MAPKKKVIKDSVALTISRVAIFGINFAKNVVLAKLLNPAGFGVLNIINLVLNYNKFAQLGLRQAAMREAPLEIGKKEERTAEELKSVAFTFNLIFSFAASVFLMVLSFLYRHDAQLMLAYFVSGIVFSLTTIYALYEANAMIYDNFVFISKARFLESTIKFVIVLFATLFFGLKGTLVSIAVASVMVIFYCASRMKLKFNPKLSLAILGRLSKVGLPLFIGGVVWSFLLTADRLLIVSHIDKVGKEQYGLYSFAVVILTIFYVISSDTGSVIYRHSLGIYGRTQDAKRLYPVISKPSRFVGYMCPFIVGQIFILTTPVISYVLPKYIGAIPIIHVLSVAFFLLMLGVYHTTLMTTLDRQRLHLYIRSFFLALLLGSIIMLIRHDCSIFYISIAKMTVWGMYSLFIIVFTCKFIVSNKRQLFSYLTELFMPASLTALFLLCLSSVAVNRFVLSFIFILAYIPIILIANKRLNLSSILKEFSDKPRVGPLTESEGV